MKYVSQLNNVFRRDEIIFAYQGVINELISRPMISIIERCMDKQDDSLNVKRRVYISLMLCVGDIIDHLVHFHSDEEHRDKYLLTVGLNKEEYKISVGYQIQNEHLLGLRTKLDALNHLDNKEVRQAYNNTKLESPDIEVTQVDFLYLRKKTNRQINYRFDPIDDKRSYFTYQVSIARNLKTEVQPVLEMVATA